LLQRYLLVLGMDTALQVQVAHHLQLLLHRFAQDA
jgi:hypothetical protein